MATLLSGVHYWLVDHPIISQYEWKLGQTPGASPLFVSIVVATYVSVTLLLHYFPILPNLSPSVLRLTTVAHNIVLCLLSLAMAIGSALSILHQTPPDNLSWCICFPDGATARRGPMFFWAYVFYFSKILEFIDTLLILLSRSSARRLSFLHVYHHAMMPVICYLYLAEPQSSFSLAVVANSSVHVLMYTYYLMSSLGLRPRWKRMVTNCQIAQFLLGYLVGGLIIYFHLTGSGCSGMRYWFLHLVFATSLLALFTNFHLMNYSQKRKLG